MSREYWLQHWTSNEILGIEKKKIEKRHKSVLKNHTKFHEIASERLIVRFVNILNNPESDLYLW